MKQHTDCAFRDAKGKNMEIKSKVFTVGLLFGLGSSFLKIHDYKQ